MKDQKSICLSMVVCFSSKIYCEEKTTYRLELMKNIAEVNQFANYVNFYIIIRVLQPVVKNKSKKHKIDKNRIETNLIWTCARLVTSIVLQRNKHFHLDICIWHLVFFPSRIFYLNELM